MFKCSRITTHLQGPFFDSLDPPSYSDSLNKISDTDDLQRQIALLSICTWTAATAAIPQPSPSASFTTRTSSNIPSSCNACNKQLHRSPLRFNLRSLYISRPLILHSGAKLHAPSWLGRSLSRQHHQVVQKPHLACIFCRLRKIPCGAPSPGSVDKSCK